MKKKKKEIIRFYEKGNVENKMINPDTLKDLRQALIMGNVIDERNLHFDYQ